MSKYEEDNIVKNKLELEELKAKVKTVTDKKEAEVIYNRIKFLESHIPKQDFNNKWTTPIGHFKWRIIPASIIFLLSLLGILLLALYI